MRLRAFRRAPSAPPMKGVKLDIMGDGDSLRF